MRNPLNSKSVDGNIYAWLQDSLRNEGIRHQDQYLCRECKSIVWEKDWDFKKLLCLDCVKDLNG